MPPRAAAGLGALAAATLVWAFWMIFFYAPTERTMGVVQRIFYVHVPSAWVAFLAFGIVALCSAGYLWLRDERLDAIAVSRRGARAGLHHHRADHRAAVGEDRVGRVVGLGAAADAHAAPLVHLRRLLHGAQRHGEPGARQALRRRPGDRGGGGHPADPHERAVVPLAAPAAGDHAARRARPADPEIVQTLLVSLLASRCLLRASLYRYAAGAALDLAGRLRFWAPRARTPTYSSACCSRRSATTSSGAATSTRKTASWSRELEKRSPATSSPSHVLSQELLGLLGELKAGVPFFSPRYIGHMSRT
jgi:hypothetical protein